MIGAVISHVSKLEYTVYPIILKSIHFVLQPERILFKSAGSNGLKIFEMHDINIEKRKFRENKPTFKLFF